ncbi:class I SAM-dependent DNA methyltransferase [Agrobacterium sp. CNPSo 3708]|uniref:type I restriction-modification system subunit M n=1 Tax=Agrobacterium sp. CNPSo 3708 TaxID=3028150 RepID=UPI00236482C4|nr:class I SAM-dependent DNA methyltransferase [Agrobacterium sp. CNPSo 3708]MDD1498564.1 class I SAM-dependent DNA methyltransferase [Agrobacterium sp. CNPSo 3708]
MATHSDLANLIWQIADLLRGPYRPPQYERVMLPLVVLRRFDCVLADTKEKVLAEYERRANGKLQDEALDRILNKAAGHRFHNRSALDFQRLKGDPDNLNKHLVSYIKGFSGNVQRIFEYFEFENEIERMHDANILYLVIKEFCDVDLHPLKVTNQDMGLVFENLIRRFNELANETAGDHFTPREVITLMTDLLFLDADDLLSKPGIAMRMLDPACGTGGMLAGAQKYMRDHHADATLYVYGQDYNKRAFATAASDMLIKEVDHNGGGENVQFGDSFLDDKFAGQTFDYFIANPPFGVDWKKQQKDIIRRHEKASKDSPWRAGLPRVNDGSLLFLQHMISKFEVVDPQKQKYGSRAAIVFSGSPLFTGGAGGGESEIRRWIIERDMLEAIVALPEQMFYNTGIGTYIWIVTNRKAKERKGKIQLVDARETWIQMRRSQGDKRRKIGEGPARDGDERADEPDQIADIVRLYGRFQANEKSKIFNNQDFGYTRVTVERALKLRYQMTVEDKARFLDAAPHLLDDIQIIDQSLGREAQFDWNAVWASVEKLLKKRGSRWKAAEEKLFRTVFTAKDAKGAAVKKGVGFEADAELRDFENVPLKEDIEAYFKREVLPHVPDAWLDRSKDKVGYEINFNRHFYKFTPPRKLAEIDADLKKAEDEILRLLREVTE